MVTRSGQEYARSPRDGRAARPGGERVEDVTGRPASPAPRPYGCRLAEAPYGRTGRPAREALARACPGGYGPGGAARDPR
ncbi:hypothetical protein RND61_00425 [Streptomyces sp. TRM76323]|uniref:Uncharacterized protein n=1 Tax=Streptomyces tamarix TaxID=3078565 RepID=A0ABU3QCR0_9ACTN|nr:hypothetical protein [Streptomyces tamarix]MDT9680558.1 hypothetical protein [Streptomyces tamarix]